MNECEIASIVFQTLKYGGARLRENVKGKFEVISRISVFASSIIALFLALLLLSELNAHTETGPNLAIVVGFLVTVIICVILGSWVALKDETTHKIPLLISLLLGSGLIFLLSLFIGIDVGISSPAWREYHPLAVYNSSLTVNCLLALTLVLAVEGIAVLISILRARRD